MGEATVETADAPTIGAEIRERRKRRGWTQRELAARFGCGRELVARWEGGHPVGGPYWPDLDEILRIRVDPAAPGGWVDADEDDRARAANRQVVNVVVVVASTAKARELLRALGASPAGVELATADEVVRRLGVAPAE